MALSKNKNYFVSKPHAYLRANPTGGKKLNHLLLGDWLRVLDTTPRSQAVKVRCRGDEGWLRMDEFSEKRALEVNFVDIGQGDGCHIVTPDDAIILIDAGVGSNMNRFLSWRYNLRSRNVQRAPDFEPDEPPREPWRLDHVVISHPDKDHYYGFSDIFENLKLKIGAVYHNGIVERPEKGETDRDPNLFYHDDLGGYAQVDKTKYLWDVVDTDDRFRELIEEHSSTRKRYLSTMRDCLVNSPDVAFNSVAIPRNNLDEKVYLGPFDQDASISLQVLGPITEEVQFQGESRHCLRRLGRESITKNGHSVVLRLTCGKLSVLLGGDLNIESQDFLLQQYTSLRNKVSSLEKKVRKLSQKGEAISATEQRSLDAAQAKLDAIVAEARNTFECDVAKACHHGSPHFSDAFLRATNAIATVISSGDNESYAHPRPDALGAYGKYGRGDRPLIFSTELARSVREFTPIIEHFEALNAYLRRIEATDDPAERRRLEREMEEKRDRNVAVYGMITLRALDDHAILAQKLEQPRKSGVKWDIHELIYNQNTERFESVEH